MLHCPTQYTMFRQAYKLMYDKAASGRTRLVSAIESWSVAEEMAEVSSPHHTVAIIPRLL